MRSRGNHLLRQVRTTGILLAGFCIAATAWKTVRGGYELPPHKDGTVLLDRQGSVMRIQLGDDDLDCRPASLDQVSGWVRQALVAVEDKRFFVHHGVDPFAMLRACTQNLLSGRRVSGASTISTQVIRLAEPRPRTLWSKILEALKAFRLERTLDKHAILEQHLNRASFGGNLVGIEAAANRYFGKAPADLDLAEAALLAGLPQSPSRLRPDRNPAGSRRRMQHVLDRMLEEGFISESQHAQALARPISAGVHARPFAAPHFSDWILSRHHGGTVRTSLDPRLQAGLEQLLRSGNEQLREAGIDTAAAVILEVRSGNVRAMTGSLDYFNADHGGQVNHATAKRSPGSALKPFLYGLAFDQGIAGPGTMLEDRPRHFRDYIPANFDRQFYGEITAREALVRSLNLPALDLAEQVGIERLLNLLRDAGLKTLDRDPTHYGLSLVLGGGEVTLLGLCAAYSLFAREGRWTPATGLEETSHGPSIRLLSAEAAYLVSDILSGPERAMDMAGSIADVMFPRFAWKTGTSSGQRDAWTIAWNPEYVVGVWMGNSRGERSSHLVGTETAAPIAGALFRMLYPGGSGPWYEKPPGIEKITLSQGHRDYVIKGLTAAEPVRPRSSHLEILVPFPGSVYETAVAPSTITLEASKRKAPLYWYVNGRLLGRTDNDTKLSWVLEPGTWTIACLDEDGSSAESRVTVRAPAFRAAP